MHINRRSMIAGLAAIGVSHAGRAIAGTQSIAGQAFGSSWRIVVPVDANTAEIRAEVDNIVAKINRQMSPYLASSDLSRFNCSDSDDWQPMPAPMCTVAAEALHIARLTRGAFDPTVGPVVAKFGYGPIRGGSGQHSDITVGKDAIRKADPQLTLDLCGIAKGFALGEIAAALNQMGVADALVEVGGEVRALGVHPDGRGWQVAISDPTATDFRAFHVVSPGQFALATSGHAANGLRAPVSTSHIIDPHRNKPAQSSLASVSVLAISATEADALATAFCAAGPVRGPELARRLDVAALFIFAETNAPRDIITGAFARHILI